MNKHNLPLFLLIYCLFICLTGCEEAPLKRAHITFQFDHPYISQYSIAKPLLDSKGIKATLMVNTAAVGTEYMMSWEQLKEMYNEGWEVGSHTVNHPDLRKLKEMEIRHELSKSKAVLEANGFYNINNFAYPYNFYNMDVIYAISDYYRSARTSVAETDFNINPENISPYELSSYIANINIDNLTEAYKLVDKAQREGRWLIFLFHEFIDAEIGNSTLSRDVSYIDAVEKLIDYIQAVNIPIVTTEQALNYYVGSE